MLVATNDCAPEPAGPDLPAARSAAESAMRAGIDHQWNDPRLPTFLALARFRERVQAAMSKATPGPAAAG